MCSAVVDVKLATKDFSFFVSSVLFIKSNLKINVLYCHHILIFVALLILEDIHNGV